jgi:uncharacterized iron-regulated membrane protein
MHALDVALNPALFRVAPPAGQRAGQVLRADPALIQAVSDGLTRDPRYGKPSMLELPTRAGAVVIAWYRPAPGQGHAPWGHSVRRQIMVDPATLRVTGERHWGELGVSPPSLMPTLFHLHRFLVAGEVGKVVVAITGVSLLLMVFTGMILWWPRMVRSAIWKAVTVRHGLSWPRLSFQLHRAGGFFAAPVLLVSALSGTYFNMPQWVLPAVSAISALTPNPKLANQSLRPRAAISIAEAMSAAQAKFPDGRISRVTFPANTSLPYEIRLRQPGELRQGPGATRVSIDSGDASVIRVVDPQRATGGDQFVGWLFPLHTGEAFGLGGRIFISLFGVVPLAFFVTGLITWIKLRKMKIGRQQCNTL